MPALLKTTSRRRVLAETAFTASAMEASETTSRGTSSRAPEWLFWRALSSSAFSGSRQAAKTLSPWLKRTLVTAKPTPRLAPVMRNTSDMENLSKTGNDRQKPWKDRGMIMEKALDSE